VVEGFKGGELLTLVSDVKLKEYGEGRLPKGLEICLSMWSETIFEELRCWGRPRRVVSEVVEVGEVEVKVGEVHDIYDRGSSLRDEARVT
jgi:hypothetical protein